MGSFATVINQVAVMMILIAVGFVLTKLGKLSETGVADITSLLLYVVTPCLILNSLLGIESISARDLVLAMLLPALAITIAIVLSLCFFRKDEPSRKKVLRFSAAFSNAGFMGLPLVQGIVGDEGVALGSFFVVVFNLFCWTYGYGMMSGGKVSVKKALLNPGVIGLAVGLPVCLLKISLPKIVTSPISFLSGLNTPLAMLVIGSYVARADIKSVLRDKGVYLSVFLRLIFAPAIFLLVLVLIKPGRVLFLTNAIQAASPVAANAVLFSVAYKADSRLASGTVALSTLFSIVSLPLIAAFSEYLCGILGLV